MIKHKLSRNLARTQLITAAAAAGNINSFSWLIVTRSNSRPLSQALTHTLPPSLRPVIRKRRGTFIFRSVTNGTVLCYAAGGDAYFDCTAQKGEGSTWMAKTLDLGCVKSHTSSDAARTRDHAT